ncbi:MAG TPA: hypothetical protein VME69_17015 [Methylocella sp.]|nr:hypothetical protein [Methylocella sp.]
MEKLGGIDGITSDIALHESNTGDQANSLLWKRIKLENPDKRAEKKPPQRVRRKLWGSIRQTDFSRRKLVKSFLDAHFRPLDFAMLVASSIIPTIHSIAASLKSAIFLKRP